MDTHGEKKRLKLLPENAYTKLKEGEEYTPIVGAGDTRAEVTPWSITLGLILVVIFSGACIYMALRAGNAIEAAIPIAILAIFFGKMKKIKSTILENVIVQSVGQAAGVVAAGAAFLIPALYINELTPPWWQIFLACFIGGSLGVVLIIPLRKYFVKDLHGDLPYPEGTAINEILVSGESAGATAGKVLIMAFFMGAFYDFMAEGVHLWNPAITSGHLLGSIGESMSEIRLDMAISGLAALFGLGYIIGLRYSSIIAAGSVLACLVMVPMIYLFGSQVGEFDYAGALYNIKDMNSNDIFGNFVKPIGIGAIAISGLVGIIRMGKIVISSISLGFKGLKGGWDTSKKESRLQIDINPKNVLLIQLGSALLLGL
ncbi:MAG: peptide transporter, partial [bacterium]|nr:peptide transporter [bacterium]